MKTTIALLFALGTTLAATNAMAGDTASCCADKATALSPRAQANQTVVVSGKADGDFARADLGTGARSKAFGGNTLNSTSGKDTDAVRGRYGLGVAAKEKATGNTGSADIQIAPLK
jgi:hypothetical protein